MSELILTTYDWVPEMPRGMVRDLRVRWALEEGGLAYRVESTPFRDRSPEHFAAQPFGQQPVPDALGPQLVLRAQVQQVPVRMPEGQHLGAFGKQLDLARRAEHRRHVPALQRRASVCGIG